MYPLLAITLLFFFLSCKADPLVDYEEAINNCPIDTNRISGPDGIHEIYLKTYRGLVGAQMPDFTAQTIDGKEINKAYFEGKVSVINFWFIGCHPCEEEMPVFNQMVEKYKDKNVNFLALSLNSPKDIEEFLVANPFDVDHIGYAEPFIQNVFHMMWGYPITFVIDQKLKILLISRGLGTIEKVTEPRQEFAQVIDKALATK